MIAQCKYLHETLAGEYHNEYHIKIVQHTAERFRLFIMVHCHGQHIKSDEQHNYHIELLICHNFKHYCLGPPLEIRENQNF